MPARAEPLPPVARHEDRQQRATRAVADVTVEPLVAAADGSSSPAAVGSSSHAEAEPSKTFPPLFERPPLCLVAFALLLSTAVALLCTVFRDALAVVLRQKGFASVEDAVGSAVPRDRPQPISLRMRWPPVSAISTLPSPSMATASGV